MTAAVEDRHGGPALADDADSALRDDTQPNRVSLAGRGRRIGSRRDDHDAVIAAQVHRSRHGLERLAARQAAIGVAALRGVDVEGRLRGEIGSQQSGEQAKDKCARHTPTIAWSTMLPRRGAVPAGSTATSAAESTGLRQDLPREDLDRKPAARGQAEGTVGVLHRALQEQPLAVELAVVGNRQSDPRVAAVVGGEGDAERHRRIEVDVELEAEDVVAGTSAADHQAAEGARRGLDLERESAVAEIGRADGAEHGGAALVRSSGRSVGHGDGAGGKDPQTRTQVADVDDPRRLERKAPPGTVEAAAGAGEGVVRADVNGLGRVAEVEQLVTLGVVRHVREAVAQVRVVDDRLGRADPRLRQQHGAAGIADVVDAERARRDFVGGDGDLAVAVGPYVVERVRADAGRRAEDRQLRQLGDVDDQVAVVAQVGHVRQAVLHVQVVDVATGIEDDDVSRLGRIAAQVDHVSAAIGAADVGDPRFRVDLQIVGVGPVVLAPGRYQLRLVGIAEVDDLHATAAFGHDVGERAVGLDVVPRRWPPPRRAGGDETAHARLARIAAVDHPRCRRCRRARRILRRSPRRSPSSRSGRPPG